MSTSYSTHKQLDFKSSFNSVQNSATCLLTPSLGKKQSFIGLKIPERLLGLCFQLRWKSKIKNSSTTK